MPKTTVLKGDAEGGLLDKLLNSGELPEAKITITKESVINLGAMLLVVLLIYLLISTIVKMIVS